MPRNPFQQSVPLYPKKEKKNFYAIYFAEKPETSTIVNTWNEAMIAMKGARNIFHKGFLTKTEALAWMAETNKVHTTEKGNTVKTIGGSPKEAAVADYPVRVGHARNQRRLLFYVDCSFEPKTKFCGGGIWCPTVFFQKHILFSSPEDTVVKNHQWGELAAIRAAFQHYVDNMAQYKDYTGICLFTDSDWCEKTINTWVHQYKNHKNAGGQWLTARNTPVKFQDVIQDILNLKREMLSHNKGVDVFYIPRDLNSFADTLSRGGRINREVDKDGEEKFIPISC